MSVQSKMTDIADATRKLSGASGLLDLDEIIFHQEHVGTSLDGQGNDIFNAALSLAAAGFGDPIYDPDYELRDNNTIYKQADAVEHVEAQAEAALDAVEDMGALVGGMQVVDAPRIMTAMGGLIGDANTKTGQSDATLTAAVQRLIAGYGGGSSVKTGTITPTSRTQSMYIADLAGCTNAIILPTTTAVGQHGSSGHRTHAADVFLGGKNVLRASTNSGDTSISAQIVDGLADSTLGDTLSGGTIEIGGTVTGNYGGDFVPISYTYWGW